MPIEFRCSQCGKLLRTGDETAGREAQCPECGALSRIPTGTGSAQALPPSASPGSDAFASTPAGSTDSGQPFGTAYQNSFLPADPFAAARVSAPATALIITGVLGVVGQVVGVVVNLIQITVGAGLAGPGREVVPAMFGAGVYAVVGVFGIALCVLVVVGAMKMKRLESYSLAMAAAVLSVVPCTSPCCLLGVPFGIWALIMLNDSSVKAAFRS
jgi:DNA-directed RNA polymerase subunit RPC12/RpoP